jgi:hypothetical protein
VIPRGAAQAAPPSFLVTLPNRHCERSQAIPPSPVIANAACVILNEAHVILSLDLLLVILSLDFLLVILSLDFLLVILSLDFLLVIPSLDFLLVILSLDLLLVILSLDFLLVILSLDLSGRRISPSLDSSVAALPQNDNRVIVTAKMVLTLRHLGFVCHLDFDIWVLATGLPRPDPFRHCETR